MRAQNLFSVRLHAVFIVLVVAALFAVAPAMAACGNGVIEAGEDCDDGGNNGSFNSCCTTQCFFTGKSPDVIVGDVTGVSSYGTVGGISAYAVGTTSCNLGSCWLKWISNNAEHPVIGQNAYRLKNGRFEQIGQSWLKHGFTALQQTTCSNDCVPSGTGTRLGVLCSDPYGSSLNGTQTNLGPKSDVNANDGVYLYPDARINTSGNAIFKRLQVHNTDIDPALNAGAVYFVEGQYVTKDDAEAKNQNNNASYRSATFSGTSPNFSLALGGSTQRQKAGIQAWKATDPSVTETIWDASGGRFIMSAKATALGGGLYHYEYAVQNLNNNRAAMSFSVPLPAGTTVTNVGFHDVDYHSGEPFNGDDWTPVVTAASVTWSTRTYAEDPNGNALRWGTLYNFRFDADVAPGTSLVTLGYFKPGAGTSATKATVTPGPCGGAPNGTGCDDRNACTQSDSCQAGACTGSNPVICAPSDACHTAGTCDTATGACSNPVAQDGTGCLDGDLCTTGDTCVSGFCVAGTPVTCTALDDCHDAGTCDFLTGDCSNPEKTDGTSCDDANDCTVDDACSAGACSGTGAPMPGEIGSVQVDQVDGQTTLTWDVAPNSTSSAILRGLTTHLPVGPGGDEEVCIEDIAGNTYVDADVPPESDSFWYLVQGRTSCGGGPYGSEFANGLEAQRVSTTCP